MDFFSQKQWAEEVQSKRKEVDNDGIMGPGGV